MSTLVKTKNPHITALETVLKKAKQPAEVLVFSQKDARMHSSLAFTLRNESAAILEVSDSAWNFESEEICETIEWALQNCDATRIVLVGSPNLAGVEDASSDQEPIADAEGGYGKLLEGVKRENARYVAAKHQFAASVQQVSKMQAVQENCAQGQLSVSGMFYQPPFGFFLAYDVDADTFRPFSPRQ